MISDAFRESLSSGASRIFNTLAATNAVRARDGAAPLLFRHGQLNDLIFLKMVRRDRSHGAIKLRDDYAPGRGQIVTTLYLPFERDNIRAGGNTFEMGGAGQHEWMVEVLGFDRTQKDDGTRHDMEIIEAIARMPSLDPFLLKERLLRIDPAIDPAYINLSDEAFEEIKRYILKKFAPIAEFAIPRHHGNFAELAQRLIMTIWEGRDTAALTPIIQTFRLDPAKAADVFYAWKGITFYEFEYLRAQAQWKSFALWLGRADQPPYFVKPADKKALTEATAEAVKHFKRNWKNVATRLGDYGTAYRVLFVERKSPGQFVEFLQKADGMFWEIAAGMSAVNHAMAVWRQRTARHKDNQPPPAELKPLVDQLGEIMT